MSNESVVIVAAKRTPMGGFNGNLSSLAATKLGEVAIKAACEEMDVSVIDEVIMGCVLPAGLGQSPARQASLGAGLPLSAGVTTINKVCGSGLKAVMMAHDLIKAGSATAVVAGGMESMSNAPYMLPKARTGYRMGHGQVLDQKEISDQIDLFRSLTIDDLRRIPGLEVKRADVILAGTLILRGLMNHVGVDHVYVSTRGVRYGVMIDRFLSEGDDF